MLKLGFYDIMLTIQGVMAFAGKISRGGNQFPAVISEEAEFSKRDF